jgi:hypothetical protein
MLRLERQRVTCRRRNTSTLMSFGACKMNTSHSRPLAILLAVSLLPGCAAFGIGRTECPVGPADLEELAKLPRIHIENSLLEPCPEKGIPLSGDPVLNHTQNMDLLWPCADRHNELIRAVEPFVEK